ncbi:MAG: ThuA domain-containing protein [Ginsengibacter sp.]
MHKKLKLLIGTVILIFVIFTINTPAEANDIIQEIKQNLTPGKKKPHIVFLITEDSLNYEAHKTIPLFAEMLKKDFGYKVTVILGSGTHGAYTFPNFGEVSKADLLVIFARRVALPSLQMNAIKSYLSKGKPLIGIRTANHAFTVRDKIVEGFEEWPAFVADIIGCENRGYGPTEPGTDVSVVPEAIDHPIVKNLSSMQWHSKGNVYLVSPLLDKTATVLLTGKVNNITEPIAWTRTVGNSRIFYTSLGYPADFETPEFITLLINGIKWTLDKKDNLKE